MDYNTLIRRRTFVLDTKTTCFLCLRDIPPAPPPITPGGGGEDVEVNKQCESQVKRMSLRSILVYLNLNPGKVFHKLSSGTLKDTAKLLKEITNFSVSLCPDCLEVSEGLSGLCKELEEMRMKVDLYLEYFYELLAYSENDQELIGEFRGKMTGPLEFIQRTIAESLRMQAKEKCRTKLNHTKPRVNIKRMEEVKKKEGLPLTFITPTETPSAPPPPPPPTTPIASNSVLTAPPTSPLKPAPVLKIISTKGLPLPPNMRLFIPISRSSLIKNNVATVNPTPTSTIPPSSSSTAPSENKCEPCGLKFSSRDDWVNHLKLNCLLSTKRPLKPESFPGIEIIEVKRPTVTRAGPLIRPKPVAPPSVINLVPSPPKFQPQVPQNMFDPLADPLSPSSESYGHSPIKTPPISITKTSPITISPSSSFYNKRHVPCQYCRNGEFRNNMELSRHQAQLHSEQFFLSLKLPCLSQDIFKKDCEQLIQTLVTFSKITKDTTAYSERDSFKCVYCPKNSEMVSGWTKFYIHLVKGHPDIISTKLVFLQEKKFGMKLNKPIDVPPKSSFSSPLPPPPPSQGSKDLLKRSESLLYSWLKQRRQALKQVSSARNRRSLNHTENIQKTKTKAPTLSNKCEFCPTIFQHRTDLHKHLKLMHYLQLLQKQHNYEVVGLPRNGSVLSEAPSTSSSVTNESVESFSAGEEGPDEDDNMIEESEVFPYKPLMITPKKEPVQPEEMETEVEMEEQVVEEKLTFYRGDDEATSGAVAMELPTHQTEPEDVMPAPITEPENVVLAPITEPENVMPAPITVTEPKNVISAPIIEQTEIQENGKIAEIETPVTPPLEETVHTPCGEENKDTHEHEVDDEPEEEEEDEDDEDMQHDNDDDDLMWVSSDILE